MTLKPHTTRHQFGKLLESIAVSSDSKIHIFSLFNVDEFILVILNMIYIYISTWGEVTYSLNMYFYRMSVHSDLNNILVVMNK